MVAEIPEDEQWRLSEQSGVLKQLLHSEPTHPSLEETQNQEDSDSEDVEGYPPLAEEIFNSILLIIPFTSLNVMMDMYADKSLFA